MTLTLDQFEFIRWLLDDQVGMALEVDQQRFVAGRLGPIAMRHGFNQLTPLIARLRDQNDRLLAQEVIEALVTHETSFFRDPHYFDELTERILPRLIARRAAERRLNIWCAACATGQEAYSIAMVLRERFGDQLRDWTIDLIATDLSSAALQQAQSGRYSDVEVRRGLSDARLALHFRREPNGWQIDDRLKQVVRFQQMNLTGTWPQLPTLDLVLLRNVLIYMSPATKLSILSRIQKSLHSEGCLMLGSSESVSVPNLNIACARPGTVPGNP